MRLPNVEFAPTGVPTISEMVGMAAQAVGDGQCHTCLVIYPTGNLEGRYRRGGENADDYARGARQWTAPWGNHGGNDFINIFPHNQYCLKYGGKHDDQVDSTAQMLDWFKRGGQEPQDWMWQLYKQAQARGPQPTRPEPLSVMARRLGILRSLY